MTGTLVHWHTCKKCKKCFTCRVGTKSTKHCADYNADGSRIATCTCNGLCEGYKRGEVCSGC